MPHFYSLDGRHGHHSINDSVIAEGNWNFTVSGFHPGFSFYDGFSVSCLDERKVKYVFKVRL
jgi:hypothetical protein